MQKAEVVLSMLSKKSINDINYQFSRVYRNLFNLDFYVLAYNNIRSKTGNMTAGIDGQTIDGFNLKMAENIIEHMYDETYQPKPVLRKHLPKKSGKTRLLGIPSFRDKLVQEVLRLILEAVYEPTFLDTSHGFRPNRSCHTALMQIKKTCKGTNWVIKGDIKGFFGNIDHVVLLNVLAQKIDDGRFLGLISKFLKAGYMEFKQVYYSLTGTPQGGIIGPILANIYLHELDKHMAETCEKYNTKAVRKRNQKYVDLSVAGYEARKAGKTDLEVNIPKRIRSMNTQAPFDKNYIKIKYVRYADDFLVMIIGSKKLAEQIRENIRVFIKNINLELNIEKNLITNLTNQRVRFLGYEIAKTKNSTVLTQNTLGIKTRAANGTIQLLVPAEAVREKLAPFVVNGKSVYHSARINLPLLDLLSQYNAEIRGLYNYYCLATDVSAKIGRFKFYHYYSLLKTVARKEKISVKKVLEKYSVDVKRKQEAGTRRIFGITYQTEDGPQTITYFNNSLKKVDKLVNNAYTNEIVGMVIPQRH